MVTYAFDAQHLIENGRVRRNDVDKLYLWLETETEIPKLNDRQLCLFLIACENNIEATKKSISHYYLVRKNAPELFDNRNTEREEIVRQLKSLQFCIIPLRTKDNNSLLINRLSDPVAANYHMDVAMKILFMVYDSVLYEDPPDGIILIFDMNLTSLRHIPRTKFSILRKVVHYVQEAVPVRLKEIHVLNALWFIDKFLALLRPFFSKELLDKVHIHTADKLEQFHERHVPTTHLPSDYGGALPSVEEIHNDTCRKLTVLNEHFREEEEHRKNFYKNQKEQNIC